ncbi:MAG: hypothetical protein AAF597_15355, partial [Bacteroidota bacterium]
MSGNKYGAFAFVALLLLFVSSCDALKPAVQPNPPRTDTGNENGDGEELDPLQSRRVYDPETGTWVYVDNA